MITAILTVYKRPHVLLEQISALKNQTVKPEKIMIWVNGDAILPELNDPNIIITRCSDNLKFHARFAYGLLSKTKYVAFFDDDSIPNEKWFESCLNCIKEQDGIYGSTGVVLTGNNYTDNYKVGWNAKKNENTTRVHLVGHSWFMKRDTIKYLWVEEPVSWENGEDIQLSYFSKKYGDINTYVPPHPTSDQTIWGTKPETGMKYGNDENATWLTVSNHTPIRNTLCEKFLKDGWKL